MNRVPDDAVTGIELSRAYVDGVVAPLLASRLPGLRFAAGRLGTGSDVLGFDDLVSRDHDWGLRLELFVAADAVGVVEALLEDGLPDSFQGYPTRFAFTGESEARHHVAVGSVAEFAVARLGFDPREDIGVHDWLSVSGQAALEVTAGAVFTDQTGELESLRSALAWYPDDLWRYVLACDWERIDQELPLMGRAADAGDESGSRIIAARLTQIVMHLAFLLERSWPPYAKWFGSRFAQLKSAGALGPSIAAVLDGHDRDARYRGLTRALQSLLERQNDLGLTAVDTALIPFWDRPHLHPDPAIATQLLGGISDPEVQRLPRGRGSIDQRTDNVAVLMDPHARRSAVSEFGPGPATG